MSTTEAIDRGKDKSRRGEAKPFSNLQLETTSLCPAYRSPKGEWGNNMLQIAAYFIAV